MNEKQRLSEISRLHEEADYYANVASWAFRSAIDAPDKSYWDNMSRTYTRMSQKCKNEADRIAKEHAKQ